MPGPDELDAGGAFQERRQFARTPVQMTAWCRLLEHAEAPLRLQEAWAVGGPERTALEVLEKVRLPEGMAAFLLHLDAKLDAMLGFLLAEKLAKEFPYTMRVVELSGNGIRTQTMAPLQPGALLEVALLLHHAPVRVAGAVARVLRADTEPPPSGEAPAFALEFAHIREPDFEAIMQFVFHEERKRLRERLRSR
ncbi:PilZ domain-containing protein [Megalodesulfovibrio gigas]|nr:PilZ domain-containing protein [Megalodesulfovibrio gigas]